MCFFTSHIQIVQNFELNCVGLSKLLVLFTICCEGLVGVSVCHLQKHPVGLLVGHHFSAETIQTEMVIAVNKTAPGVIVTYKIHLKFSQL
jgi:hypothetical protein